MKLPVWGVRKHCCVHSCGAACSGSSLRVSQTEALEMTPRLAWMISGCCEAPLLLLLEVLPRPCRATPAALPPAAVWSRWDLHLCTNVQRAGLHSDACCQSPPINVSGSVQMRKSCM